MDGWLYYAIIFCLAVLAFTYYQNHSNKMAILMVLVGVYIVYSHETGNTATDLKNEMVKALDESLNNYKSIRED